MKLNFFILATLLIENCLGNLSILRAGRSVSAKPVSKETLVRLVSISLFGFNISDRGKSCFDNLMFGGEEASKRARLTDSFGLSVMEDEIESIELIENNITNSTVFLYRNSVTPTDLFTNSNHLYIGYFKPTQLLDAEDRLQFLSCIQAIVDRNIAIHKSNYRSKLFLIIDGNDTEFFSAKEQIDVILKAVPSSILEYHIGLAIDLDLIRAAIVESAVIFANNAQKTTIFSSLTSSPIEIPVPSTTFSDRIAAAKCLGLAEDLLSETKTQLHRSLPSVSAANTNSAVAATQTVQQVKAAIETALQLHSKRHSESIKVLRGGAALEAAGYRYRALLLSDLLLPLYRQLLESATAQSLELLDRRIVLNSPSTMQSAGGRARQRLVQIAEQTLTEHRIVAETFAAEFRSIVSGGGEGLLDTSLVSASKKRFFAPQRALQSLLGMLDPHAELLKLRSISMERVQERMRTLILAGSVNPFIRESPLPPMHINFNYLLDPRSLGADLQLKDLYDVAGGGLIRAEPLQLPEVAQIPFNPAEHPVPKSRDAPWHQVLWEFFTQDE